jgi:hypothetical protein
MQLLQNSAAGMEQISVTVQACHAVATHRIHSHRSTARPTDICCQMPRLQNQQPFHHPTECGGCPLVSCSDLAGPPMRRGDLATLRGAV